MLSTEQNDNNHVRQLINIATKCSQKSNFAGEIDCYQKVLAMEPHRADIYLKLASALTKQQQQDQAISAYQQAIKLKPKQPPWVYHGLGSLLSKQQKSDHAVAIYHKAIELHPKCASEFYVKIGDLYHQQNKFFVAKSYWQKARWSRVRFNINEVISCIHHHFPPQGKLLTIDILDNGCEHSGQQLALLAEQTQGRVVGTNIYPGFPDLTVQRRRTNNEFYRMDGQNLTFADESFDLVISINVLEHVPHPDQYLRECCRVLRPGGIGFFSWYPIWSGATGHHIHPDMVSEMAQKLAITPPDYGLDGSSIPFWGHLLFSASQMLSFLVEEKKYDPKLAEWMTDYTYHGHDLNRWFWGDVWHCFKMISWNILEEEHKGKKPMLAATRTQLKQKYGNVDNFDICGAKIIVQKPQKNS